VSKKRFDEFIRPRIEKRADELPEEGSLEGSKLGSLAPLLQ
jgi:hypothetical protein